MKKFIFGKQKQTFDFKVEVWYYSYPVQPRTIRPTANLSSCILVLRAIRYTLIRIGMLPATGSTAQWSAALAPMQGYAGSNPPDTTQFFWKLSIASNASDGPRTLFTPFSSDKVWRNFGMKMRWGARLLCVASNRAEPDQTSPHFLAEISSHFVSGHHNRWLSPLLDLC